MLENHRPNYIATAGTLYPYMFMAFAGPNLETVTDYIPTLGKQLGDVSGRGVIPIQFQFRPLQIPGEEVPLKIQRFTPSPEGTLNPRTAKWLCSKQKKTLKTE